MIQQTAPENSTGEHAPAVSTPRQLGNHCAALYQRLQAMRNGSAHLAHAVGVTSCGRGEGVSTVAANLAISAARLGSGSVLLVDANLEHPSVAKCFGLRAGPGFSDILCDARPPDECIEKSSVERLSVLPAGSDANRARCVVEPRPLAGMLEGLRGTYEMIVFDVPAAGELSPCFVLAGALDGILLVLEAERVRDALARRVKQQLELASAKMLGVVFNKCR